MQNNCTIACVSALFSLLALSAQASQWEFAGGAKHGNVESVLFFDAESVTHPGKSSVRVWVKEVSIQQLKRYAKTHESFISDKAGTKIASGYTPRLFSIPGVVAQFIDETTLQDATINATSWEVMANEQGQGVPTPISRFYFEIDCAGRRMKTLDSAFYTERGDLKQRSTNSVSSEFGFIAPDSNAQWWSLLLCPPQ